jgi:ATP synthase protein I
MPKPPNDSRDPLGRLDSDLAAFEAGRSKGRIASGIGGAASDGYRLLGQMLGGVLGGIGLGWLVDRFAHTSPFGVVGGLLIGAGLSIYATVRTASRVSARAQADSKRVKADSKRAVSGRNEVAGGDNQGDLGLKDD